MTMATKAGKTISKTFKQAYLHTKKETMNERLFFFFLVIMKKITACECYSLFTEMMTVQNLVV